jgi:hypothetical protein
MTDDYKGTGFIDDGKTLDPAFCAFMDENFRDHEKTKAFIKSQTPRMQFLWEELFG